MATTVTTLRTWDVRSSTGLRDYTVEERIDHDKGGTYLWCPCQGWLPQFRKGMDCRHVTVARAIMQTPPPPPPVARPGLDKYGLPVDSDASKARALADDLATHELGTCGYRTRHSAADHEAAVALGYVGAVR